MLLLERTDFPGYWQSVTGSQELSETLRQTAHRELEEETGLCVRSKELIDWQWSNRYAIYPRWRYRYHPGTTHNTEHVFSLVLPKPIKVKLSPREHRSFIWLPWFIAASMVFSWSNRDALLELYRRAHQMPGKDAAASAAAQLKARRNSGK